MVKITPKLRSHVFGETSSTQHLGEVALGTDAAAVLYSDEGQLLLFTKAGAFVIGKDGRPAELSLSPRLERKQERLNELLKREFAEGPWGATAQCENP